MPLFRTRTAENVETITAKLAAAQAALADAENEHAAEALRLALADDLGALVAIERRVAECRRRVETLELALSRAQQLERERLTAAADAVEKSRLRGLRAHIAVATAAAERYQAATAEGVAAYRDLIAALGRIERLALPRERDLRGLVQKRKLWERLAVLELSRVGAAQPSTHEINAPGAIYHQHGELLRHGQNVREAMPFGEAVRSRLMSVYSFIVGVAPTPRPAPASVEPRPSPVAEGALVRPDVLDLPFEPPALAVPAIVYDDRPGGPDASDDEPWRDWDDAEPVEPELTEDEPAPVDPPSTAARGLKSLRRKG